MSSNLKTVLISGVLILLILFKISYVLFNIYLSIILILFCFIHIFKVKKNDFNKRKKIFLGLSILITSIIIAIPNQTIFHYKHPNIKGYRNLKWSDFKGEPDNNSSFDAVIQSGFSIRFNVLFNYPTAMITTTFYPEKSWKINSNLDYKALKHEQGHFDLSKIYAQIAKDSMNENWGKSKSKLSKIVIQVNKELDKQQDLYDSITKHGTDSIEQNKWNKIISKQLKK